MFTRLHRTHPVGLIAIGVVITLVLSGTAMAVTDTSFRYSTVQTGYLMIGPGDFVPQAAVTANNHFIEPFKMTLGSTFGCFDAGVHLPQGATVTSVRTSYRSGTDSDLLIYLVRVNPVTEDFGYLIARAVSDDSSAHTYVNDLVAADKRLVNNGLFTYTYEVCFGSGTTFYGARIAYQYTSAGD